MADPEGFVARWDAVAPAVAAWARLRVRPGLRRRLDPEDLVQEVCARAYVGAAGFDPERGAFRRWVFGIAGNVLREALVQLGREPRGAVSLSGTGLLARLPDDATAVSRRVARDEALAGFCAWVDGWEGPERELLVLRGLEGRPHAEVAEILGLATETVKKRWQRLAERVRSQGAPLDLG